MGGQPAEFNDLHMSFQSWMLSDGTWDDSTSAYTEGSGGVQAWIEGLSDTIPGSYTNPYASLTPYDPTSDTTVAALEDMFTNLMLELANFDPEHYWVEALGVVSGFLSDEYDTTFLDADVTAFQDELMADAQASIGELNATLGELNAVSSSARQFGAILIADRVVRETAKHRAALRREMLEKVFDAKMNVANTLLASKSSKLALLTQTMSVSTQYAAFNSTLLRQFVNDTLQATLENDLWTLKLYEFAKSGLSSGLGASVLPARANPILDSISTGAAAIGALSPLLIAIGKTIL